MNLVHQIDKISKKVKHENMMYEIKQIQAWTAHLVVHWLGTMEVVGSNPGKGGDFSKNLNLNVD